MLYEFNKTTGEYSMEMPFETTKTETRTDVKPPKTGDNEVAVFNKETNKWKIFKDDRFTHKKMKTEGNNIIVEAIEEFGEIPEGWELITNAEAEYYEEQIRINGLKMTALDFINFLKKAGLNDEQIEDYLNANLSVKHQLQFCQNVFCGVAKALMPITFEEITITAEMVEAAFIEKNAENEETNENPTD